MERPARLSLFGVIHMDAVDKVTDELDGFAGGADALFIEYPADPAGVRTWLQVVLRTPAFFVGTLALQLFFQGPLILLFVHDLLPSEFVATRRVADAAGLPVHRVDEHPVQGAASAGAAAVLLNWLAVAPVVALEPLAAAATVAALVPAALVPVGLRRLGYRRLGPALFALAVAGVLALAVHGPFSLLLVLVGAVAFLVTVARGVDHRNDVMLDRVQRVATEEGYDDVVLVTGKGHLGGLAREAADRATSVARIHVSFWRDTGETHRVFDPADLPEIGRSDVGLRDRLRAGFADLGKLGRRALAAVVDAALVAVLWLVLAFVVLFALELVAGVPFETVGSPVLFGALYVVPVAYHAALELAWGRTVGKWLAGLVVVDTDGDGLSPRQAVGRNLLRPLDMALLYLVGAVAVGATSRRQSVGDLLAGTVVGRPGAPHLPGDDGATDGRRRADEDVPLTEFEPRTRSPPCGRLPGDERRRSARGERDSRQT